MEFEEGLEPVSPTGQYFNSSVLSVSIIAVMEFEIPINNLPSIMSLLKDVFLPINPRFSSIMTINDVITGIIFFGTRLYMQEISQKSSKADSTAIVFLSTRTVRGYKCVKEMIKPESDTPWGNQFGLLHVSIPKFTNLKSSNPLEFVLKVHKIIKKKRNSSSVYFNGCLLSIMKKLKGPEAASRYIQRASNYSSMSISNMIGPVEQMALVKHPVKGLYFMTVKVPQSLTITMVSYMGNLRVAVGSEKGFLDPHKFKSCVINAFEMTLQEAHEIPT